MKLRTKLLTLVLAALISVPFAFTSCDEKDELSDAAGTVNEVVEDVVGNTESKYAFTKEYFEANKMDVITSSVDVAKTFGADDSIFDFFRNEKLKNAIGVDFNIDVDGMKLDLGVDSSANPLKLRIDASMDGEGNPLGAPISASAYIDKEMLSVESGLFLGESAIGLKFEGIDVMLEKLANSKLGAMLEIPSAEELEAAMTKVGITDEYISNVKNALDEYISKYASGDLGYYKELESMVNDITADMLGEVGEGVAANHEGEELEAYTVEAAMDNDDFKKMMNSLFDWYIASAKDGAKLAEVIVSFNEEAAASYDMSEVTAAFEGIRDEAMSMFDSVSISGTETIYINKLDGKYFKSDVSASLYQADNEEPIVITGSEYVVDNGIIADATVSYGEEAIKINMSILNESTDDKYSIVLDADITSDFEGGPAGNLEAGFVIDKKAGTYNLYMSLLDKDEEIDFGVGGNIEYSADKFAFTVDEASMNGEVIVLPENKITLNAIDEVIAHENAKDVFELNEEELFGIFSRINAFAGN